MALKTYIWALRLLSLFSLIGFYFVAIYVDPEVSGVPGKVVFFLSLGFSLSGLFSLFLFFLRRKTLGEDTAWNNANLSLRQGILLSFLVLGLLVLQSFRILVWWDGLLAVAAVFLIELYFLSRG